MSDEELQLREEEGTPVTRKHRRNYSAEYKLEAIDWAHKYSINSAAKNSSAVGAKRKKLDGGGRPLLRPELDIQLAEWIRESRENKLPMSRRIISLEATQLFEGTGLKISNGWLNKFLKRHNFVLRCRTTTCQKPPADYIQAIAKFIIHVEQRRKAAKFSEIFAFDETSMEYDCTSNRVVDTRGAKDVTVRTTGHEKMRVTVCLCARSDGKKLMPYVLVKRKRPDPKIVAMFKGRLIINWAGSTWMNDERTEDFLRKIIGGSLFKGHRLLVWDAFECHKSEATVAVLKDLKLESAIIPGGCTKFIQARAPDVSWNKPLKAFFRQRYDLWLSNEANMEFTPAGNPRPPALELVLEWIADAWSRVSNEIIVKSFKACALTKALDGTEDNRIYCFQEDGPIGTLGLGHLREFRSQAMAGDGHNDYEGSGISDDEAEVDLGDVDSDDELILDQNEDEAGYDFDWLL